MNVPRLCPGHTAALRVTAPGATLKGSVFPADILRAEVGVVGECGQGAEVVAVLDKQIEEGRSLMFSGSPSVPIVSCLGLPDRADSAG